MLKLCINTKYANKQFPLKICIKAYLLKLDDILKKLFDKCCFGLDNIFLRKVRGINYYSFTNVMNKL